MSEPIPDGIEQADPVNPVRPIEHPAVDRLQNEINRILEKIEAMQTQIDSVQHDPRAPTCSSWRQMSESSSARPKNYKDPASTARARTDQSINSLLHQIKDEVKAVTSYQTILEIRFDSHMEKILAKLHELERKLDY